MLCTIVCYIPNALMTLSGVFIIGWHLSLSSLKVLFPYHHHESVKKFLKPLKILPFFTFVGDSLLQVLRDVFLVR